MHDQLHNKAKKHFIQRLTQILPLSSAYSVEMELKTTHGNNGWQDCDDTAETLSLCDLPLNSFASDSDEFSKDPSLDHDLFEFMSDDFTASTCNDLTDTIIFCGKLIPYKGAKVAADQPHDREFTSNSRHTRKVEPYSLRKQKKPTDKHNNLRSAKKISILTAPIKSRWYFFTLGVGKFPMEMKPSDMKMRQNRRNPSNKSLKKKSAKGLWDLLKVWLVRVNKLVL